MGRKRWVSLRSTHPTALNKNPRRPGQASIASADLRCAIAHRGTHTPRPVVDTRLADVLLNNRRGVWVLAQGRDDTEIYSHATFRFSRSISRPMPSMMWRSQIEPGSIWARVG